MKTTSILIHQRSILRIILLFSCMVVIMSFEPHMILELDSCIIALLCPAIFAEIYYVGSFHHWLLTARCIRRDD